MCVIARQGYCNTTICVTQMEILTATAFVLDESVDGNAIVGHVTNGIGE